MFRPAFFSSFVVALIAVGGCQSSDDASLPTSTIVTLLFTNDVESAYDPTPAFWLDDQEMIEYGLVDKVLEHMPTDD